MAARFSSKGNLQCAYIHTDLATNATAHFNVEHLNAHSNATVKRPVDLYLNVYLKLLYLNATPKHLICQTPNYMHFKCRRICLMRYHC